MKTVILSAPILLQDGEYRRRTVTLEEAKRIARNAENFCGHQTVKLLGHDPANARRNCLGYDVAIVLQPTQRLEFGREYSVSEILEIGVTPIVIEKKR